MKKHVILIAIFAIFMAMFSFGQITFNEVAYDSLDNASQKLFVKYGNAYEYGKTVKVQIDSIVMIIKVTGIKKSRKMVVDTVTNMKVPEFKDQFIVIYIKDNKKLAFVTPTDPRTLGQTSCTIAAAMSCSGITQGDDEFDAYQSKFNGQNIGIAKDW